LTAACTLLYLFTNDPYVPAAFSVSRPDGAFMRSDDPCPDKSAKHYFTAITASGKRVSIDLCLLAMPFGADRSMLVPYRVDDKGMIWGAAPYSSEVSELERSLENRFKLSPADETRLEAEVSRRYWHQIKEGIEYLAIGLGLFGAFVWSTGWIVRGFLGIPRGMDTRPK
jgi:hypothetical protein